MIDFLYFKNYFKESLKEIFSCLDCIKLSNIFDTQNDFTHLISFIYCELVEIKNLYVFIR